MRVFLAFEIPDELKEVLQKSKKDLIEKFSFDESGKYICRQVPKDNLHCTILFFNDLPLAEIAELESIFSEFSKISFSVPETILWQEFQFWKEQSLICLFGSQNTSERMNWLKENLPENILQFSRREHFLNWKPHITLLRPTGKTYNAFQARAEALFPLDFEEKNIYSFQKISLFQSPPDENTKIYKRLFSFDL